MSKTWSSVPTDDPEKDWSSVYTNHGTPSDSLDGTPSGSGDDWMDPAGEDVDKLNENRRRLVDIGFERGTGLGAGGGKRRTRKSSRKSRKSSRKSRKSSRKSRKSIRRRRH